jgi:hypothetical protein
MIRIKKIMRWSATIILVGFLGLAAASRLAPTRHVSSVANRRIPSHRNKPHEEPQTHDGVTFEHYVDEKVPWSINVIRIDRSRTNLELSTAIGQGSRIGLSRLTDQLESIPAEAGKPIAAINGDFYTLDGNSYEGDPRGLQILRGELVSAPIERECVWILPSGAPEVGEVTSKFTVQWGTGDKNHFGLNEARGGSSVVLYTPTMGSSTRTSSGIEFVLEGVDRHQILPLRIGETFKARIRDIKSGGDADIPPDAMVLSVSGRSQPPGSKTAAVGDVLTISTETVPDLKGVRTAIGGGPILVHNGKADPRRVDKSLQAHPRSAIGWNKENIFFVQVDGRQSYLSIGMTLPELAEFLEVKLHCDEAMNLDGGGSSEIWMSGNIMNSPCFGRERSTANTIVLLEKK